MVLQEEEGPIWKAHQTQIPPVITWGHAKWGVIYWETIFTSVNWISVRDMFNLRILRDIHSRYVDFVLAYNQADVKP